MHVYGIQDAKEREAPRYSIDDYFLARGGELVDDSTQKKQVDERPNQKGPWSRGYVCLPATEVDIMRCRYGVDVGTEEKEVNDNVYNL